MGQATTLDLGQHAASMIMASQPNQPRRETREQELLAMYNKLGDAAEVRLVLLYILIGGVLGGVGGDSGGS